MAVFVDSSVLLDVFTEDRRWFRWSSEALAAHADQGALVIDPVVYAEISVRFQSIEELESLLPPDVFEFRHIPREAAFLAAKVFRHYLQRGGSKASTLPDFFIGAHAAVEGLPLLTRDTGRFRTYFPSVRLVCP